MVNLSVTYNSYIEDFLSLFDLQSFPQCDLRNYVQTSTEVKVNRYLWPIWGRRRVVWCSASSLVSGFPRECSGLTTSHTEGRKWHRWGQYLAHSQTEPHSVSTHIQWIRKSAFSQLVPFSLRVDKEFEEKLRYIIIFTHAHVISNLYSFFHKRFNILAWFSILWKWMKTGIVKLQNWCKITKHHKNGSGLIFQAF